MRNLILSIILLSSLNSCKEKKVNEELEIKPLNHHFELIGKAQFDDSDMNYKTDVVHCIGKFKDDSGVHFVKISTRFSAPMSSLDVPNFEKRSLSIQWYDSTLYTNELIIEHDDQIPQCEFPSELEPIKKSIVLTDLDNDRCLEFWMVYYKSCQGGLSAKEMVVVLFKDHSIYTLQGSTKLIIQNHVAAESNYLVDENFSKIDVRYLDYAKEYWKVYQEEEYK